MAGMRVIVPRLASGGRKSILHGLENQKGYHALARPAQGLIPSKGLCRAGYSAGPSRKIRPWAAVICAGAGTAAIWGAVHFRLKPAALEPMKIEGVVEHSDIEEESAVESGIKAGQRRMDLPDFRLDEISKHKNSDTGIWVTFRNGVYDITSFVERHPGGKSILSAAGSSIEPFWDLYRNHKEEMVLALLEEMRIGNVHPADKKRHVPAADTNDPYVKDPTRHPGLEVSCEKPYNGEPRQELLVNQFLTPNELFFVRNHMPVPEVDVEKYCLRVSVEGEEKTVDLSLSDLKSKFKAHNVIATVQCAGGRRTDMSDHREVKGGACGINAISTAEWTGVKLSDVLRHAGINEDTANHIQFEALDKDVTGIHYGASIPVETALDPNRDVLLAYEMNGKELPRDHGYPIRVVVPGTIGARQVKWLSKIRASKEESGKHWQTNEYKVFNSSTDWHNVDFSASPAIQEYPVQSAICVPRAGTTLEEGAEEVTVRGYAWAGGGRGVSRVDVSTDGGKTWHTADLEQTEQKVHRQWAWTLWETTVPVTKNANGEVEIVCKATDTACNTQPNTFEHIWNLRGYICNAWHRVQVQLPESNAKS